LACAVTRFFGSILKTYMNAYLLLFQSSAASVVTIHASVRDGSQADFSGI